MAAPGDDDDDDYMSDKFVNPPQEVRPGLFSRGIKRQHESEKKQTEFNLTSKTKSRKELERENLEEGLKSAIDTSNKGFAMLQKMGYKPGSSIGKKGTGLTEPISISVKSDRGGLGRETAIKQQREQRVMFKKQIQEKRQKFRIETEEEFKKALRNKMAEKKFLSDLQKSQKVCEHLDTDSGVDTPEQPWFWLSGQAGEEEESDSEDSSSSDDDDVELQPSDKLQILTAYLRKKYFYCMWCGTSFNDPGDLEDNCPGDTADDH